MAKPSASPSSPLRLLMPTIRPPLSSYSSPSSPYVLPTRSPRARPQTDRPSGVRSRSGSTITSPDRAGYSNAWNYGQGEMTDGERWIGPMCRFEIVAERLELVGFQMYAVEKWIVERTRPVTVLTVYTGDPSHKIVVTALSPVSTMSSGEAEAEFKAAVQHLRKQDGARPRETQQGTLMVTSLAHFRSDYTIVHIPNGDFLAAQERLYSNINLLRMGCSGRSAVTLEEPSDTTKDRFKSTYFLSDGPPPTAAFRSKSHSRAHTRTYSQPVTTLSPPVPEAGMLPASPSHIMKPSNLTRLNPLQAGAVGTPAPSRHPHFTTYVLELVKLLQAALAICGMFPLPPSYSSVSAFDGLLCDVTIDGLRRWVAEIGEMLLGIESTERIADPSVVAALLSFVLSTRNRLSTSMPTVTKDPFLHPHELLHALSSWAHTQAVTNSTSTQTLPAATTSGNPSAGFGSGTPPVMSNQPFIPIAASTISTPWMNSSLTHPAFPNVGSTAGSTPIIYLTLALHKSLLSQQDAKIRHSDSRKVHRVILSKLELTSDSEATDEERKSIGGRVMGLVGRVGASGSGGGPASVSVPTADLGVFIREIVSGRERERDRGHEKERDAEREKGKERLGKEGEERMEGKERVGGSLKTLWSGKIEALVRMRDRAEGKMLGYRGLQRERGAERNWERDKERFTSSDVDDMVAKNLADEDLAFGGAWSGKVQKRLEMWTGINRSKKSVDLSSPVKFGGRTSAVTIPLSTQSSSSGGHVYPASEIRGLGVPALVLSHDNGEEDEPLSSGQVSPASITRTHPFTLDASPDASSANLITESGQRPIDSPESRRHGYGLGGEKGKTVATWNDWERITGDHGEAWWKARIPAQKERRIRRTRRHTFHDLSSVRHIPVLRTDWMRIDVELCGQMLMMRRREEHLGGVVRCLEYLTTTLANASTALRDAHTVHKPMIDALTSHHPAGPICTPPGTISPTLPTSGPSTLQASSVPLGLTPVAAALHALPVSPPVPALQYEAAQLHVDDMWATTREVRRKVWELRNVVFGRENVLGVGGPGPAAVGRKAKVRRRWSSQWRLDGTERAVDALGRTESEAEEEAAITDEGEAEADFDTVSEREAGTEKKSALVDGMEEERDTMGPAWLLRVFMSWGARLGIVKGETEVGGPSVPITRAPSPGEVVRDGPGPDETNGSRS